MLFKAVTEVLTPYFMQEMGDQKDAHHLSKMIKEHTIHVAMFAAVIYFNIIFICDIFGFILKDYVKAILVLKILLMTSYLAVMPIYQSFILGSPGIRKQNWLNSVMIVAGAINACISIYLIKSGWGILGVAWGTFIARIIWQILVLSFSHQYYMKAIDLDFYWKLMFPVFLLSFATWFSHAHSIFVNYKGFLLVVLGNLVLLGVYRLEAKGAWGIAKRLVIEKWNKVI